MAEVMYHRGPDASGVWMNPECTVGLSHRRLAIVDLSLGGAQPMVVSNAQLALVFNGEIYNYRELRQELSRDWTFRSESDTEVILAGYMRWGTEVVSRLLGMFAFALWDETRDTLFLARDRCGEKPLYYSTQGTRFVFASEMKGLWRDATTSRQLDWAGASQFFTQGYLTAGQSMIRGVQQLPPAHAMTVQPGTTRLWRYWDLPPAELAPATSAVELVDKLESLLGDAVRRQLVADVPVGVLLSGGVDSSLITALAVRSSATQIRTFTISFRDNPQLDESAHARLVARHCGTEHTELEGSVGGPEILLELARQFDEPLGDSSQVPTLLVSRLARRECKVVLGGDGGDELFGGYRHYNRLLELSGSRGPRWAGRLAARVASQLPFGVRGRNYLMGFDSDTAGDPQPTPRLFDAKSLRALLPGAPEFQRDDPLTNETASLLFRAQARDFRSYLPGDILTKVDRASMLASLEVRAPFLDNRLVEFAFREVPDALKATRDERKILPKLLAQKLLPPDFDVQRKQGFSIPMKLWLQGAWGDFMFEVLANAKHGVFAPRFVRQLIDGQRTGRSNGEAIFALTMFELWRLEYGISC
jgi:asparagine synthase (glutamine-hydrolysing)